MIYVINKYTGIRCHFEMKSATVTLLLNVKLISITYVKIDILLYQFVIPI